ncbi:tetrahydromethanopterin S-methyltransferase, subunit A [Methanomethylovorans hollandica DSM 15978]|uniref:Tetrahydromethanopterin S-methyltransferase, subunit A n=1 Tax=Methanomethylovorans hollandica (strain DSM 15978 / NBRC 107637 / DMS1) TaxID=867904 RepID=L0KYT2_METHD|nr:tetrahydromethanopterin S-methyltransferase subunit A [Methanomethylovorans hollandica]AGB49154.1 tetrahydromethanopterin S-methyltransferase, subunit A [Methanomethylovorans hollandica DSM 15978]
MSITATESIDMNGWPLTDGDYVIGDPDSPVAVVTLASDYKKLGLHNYAICGTCFTENFGIQKVIVNILSNPKISCLIVCGKESSHFAGQSILALVENGVSTLGGYKKIIGSNGVIPYLDEIPLAAINRFIREIEVIDLIGTTDQEIIQEAIDSYRGKERSEAPKYLMSEIDENSWRKYEQIIQQNVMSKMKK